MKTRHNHNIRLVWETRARSKGRFDTSHNPARGLKGGKGVSAADSRLEFMPTIAPANPSSRSRIRKTPWYLLRALERRAFTVGDEKQRFFMSNPLGFPGYLPLPTVFCVKRKLVNIPAASYALWLRFRPSEKLPPFFSLSL